MVRFDFRTEIGLYAGADRVSLRTMFASDAAGTRAFVTDMAERIDRCRRRRQLSRPGRSDNYCTGCDTHISPSAAGTCSRPRRSTWRRRWSTDFSGALRASSHVGGARIKAMDNLGIGGGTAACRTMLGESFRASGEPVHAIRFRPDPCWPAASSARRPTSAAFGPPAGRPGRQWGAGCGAVVGRLRAQLALATTCPESFLRRL